MLLDADRAEVLSALRAFSVRARSADVAVIYATGHGVELDGKVYLLQSNDPLPRNPDGVRTHALRLTTLGAALQAKRANLLFYGGCRDDPFMVPRSP